METNKILNGCCLKHLKEIPDESVDAIVTDPPYGISFMNKKWDYNIPSVDIWKECFRVLKYGGHLLSFSGTRTYHRMTCAIEDAGFEIRDMISWLYGSGFPKSLNIGKSVDKIQGNRRKVVGVSSNEKDFRDVGKKVKEEIGIDKLSFGTIENAERKDLEITKGTSEWEGWGTALKPACEPIVVARKPLSEKNVALNVLKWGTGGINIDACRIGFLNQDDEFESKNKNQHSKYPNSVMRNPAPNGIYHQDKREPEDYTATGRFPANVILECICDETEKAEEKISGGFGAMKIGMSDTGKGITQEYDSNKSLSKQGSYTIHTNPNCPCKILDEQTEGKVGNGHWSKTKTYGYGNFGNYCSNKEVGKSEYFGVGEKDKSKAGASRFFYCAKASKSERNLGCEEFDDKERVDYGGFHSEQGLINNNRNPENRKPTKNNHPTVKPIKLMEYLVKLISKEGQVVLDPFIGSGTTAIACINLNRSWIGIEREKEYIEIAQARINYFKQKSEEQLKQKVLNNSIAPRSNSSEQSSSSQSEDLICVKEEFQK